MCIMEMFNFNVKSTLMQEHPELLEMQPFELYQRLKGFAENGLSKCVSSPQFATGYFSCKPIQPRLTLALWELNKGKRTISCEIGKRRGYTAFMFKIM